MKINGQPVGKLFRVQIAVINYQPADGEVLCDSSVCVSDKWTAKCYRSTRSKHSFIPLKSSLPPSEIIALLNFGFALLRTCREIVRFYAFYHLPQHR